MLFYHANVFLENRFVNASFRVEKGVFTGIFPEEEVGNEWSEYGSMIPGGSKPGAKQTDAAGLQAGSLHATRQQSEPSFDLGGCDVIPGLVDIHTHGNSGADFSDGSAEGLQRMAR